MRILNKMKCHTSYVNFNTCTFLFFNEMFVTITTPCPPCPEWWTPLCMNNGNFTEYLHFGVGGRGYLMFAQSTWLNESLWPNFTLGERCSSQQDWIWKAFLRGGPFNVSQHNTINMVFSVTTYVWFTILIVNRPCSVTNNLMWT